MKYLPLRNIDPVNNALNFSTADLHIIGACDVYTTKAAGGDKKLYKDIESKLESDFERFARLPNSLSPPAVRSAASDDGRGSEQSGPSGRNKRYRSVGIGEVDSVRQQSPFGPLSQISSRRTFAYLIATLNASHPDYDFSPILRPKDFKKERNLGRIMGKIDNTLQHLRPRPQGYPAATTYLSPPSALTHPAPFMSNFNGDVWGPKMWTQIDKEMELKNCELYSYVPAADIFLGEDTELWSLHYFFFNKEKKRVCYLYLRALSVISHSPLTQPSYPRQQKARKRRKSNNVSVGDGAHKRASYWLGPTDNVDTTNYYDDDDDEFIQEPNDDEVEVPYMDLDEIRSGLADGLGWYDDEDVDDSWADQRWKRHRGMRALSEEVGDSMDL